MKFSHKNIIRIALIVFFSLYYCSVGSMDASHPWQVGFQDPATPIMEGIIFFNGLLMTFMLFIACLVGWLLYKSLTLFNEADHKDAVGFNHSTLLEVVWTIIPAGILMVISVPSYNLLYAMDEVIDPSLTIKVVGHQWYWSYECSDFEVSPTIKKDNLDQVEVSYKALKDMADLIEYSRVEVAKGEKQTQISIIKEFLESFEKDMTDVPQGATKMLSRRLEWLFISILGNEGRKEFYGPLESHLTGEMVSILAKVKGQLSEGSLIKEQQDLVIKALKVFKQYIRIVNETDLTAKTMDLFKSLDEIQPGKGNTPSSDSSSGDLDSKTGSIVAELNKVDEASYKWLELRSAENFYEGAETELSRALTQVFEAECVCLRALARGEIKIPIEEMMANLDEGRIRLDKALVEAEIAENNLIDTQLIAHQLRLTRPEREGYSSEFEWNTADVEFKFSGNELENASIELNNAKASAKWAKIDLLASQVNVLTAEYFQADAEWASKDPAIMRSKVLLKDGYDGWNEKLKAESKKVLDSHEHKFMLAHEELKSANTILDRFQSGLTPEELSKCNSIADSSEAEFMALEKQSISVVEEFEKGKDILANAKEELKNYKAVSERAEIRLERSQAAFDKFKAVSLRAEAVSKGAESFFNSAKEKLTGVEVDLNFITPKMLLDNLTEKYGSIKTEFDQSVSLVNIAKSDLASAKDRLEVVKGYVDNTVKTFYDTPIIYELPKVTDKSNEYFDNFLWEIHNEDLMTVKAQLKGSESVLEESKISLFNAEQALTESFIKLIEVELKKGKAHIDFLKLDTSSTLSSEEELVGIETYIGDLKLTLGQIVRKKVISTFDNGNSICLKVIINMIDNDLSKVSSVSGSVKPAVIKGTLGCDILGMIESAADSSWVKRLKVDVNAAISDYEEALCILNQARKILDKTADDLLTTSKLSENSSIDSLLSLQTATDTSLESTSNCIKTALVSSSAIDTILEPGSLQAKSSFDVLKAKAELANVKWFAARVSRSLDTPMEESVKPFNRQFSDVSVVESNGTLSNDNGLSGSDAAGEDGNSGNKKSKEEIKEMLSKLETREIDYTHSGLRGEVLQTFKDLVETLDQKTADDVKNMLYEALLSITNEEGEKNKSLKTQIKMIHDLIEHHKEIGEEETTERQRINFDSYLITDDDLVIPEVSGSGKAGKVFRLLEVDNRLVVPTNTHIRVLVTSADVLHSWAVPSLGVKVDACPGRLNQVFLFIKREGVFYGQCSELCGVNHGFMPIVVQAVNQDEYLTWVGKRLCS